MPDEYAGRTTRTASFKIREAQEHEVMSEDPRAYILEVIHGNMSSLHAMTERDIKALVLAGQLFLSGDMLPIEK